MSASKSKIVAAFATRLSGDDPRDAAAECLTATVLLLFILAKMNPDADTMAAWDQLTSAARKSLVELIA